MTPLQCFACAERDRTVESAHDRKRDGKTVDMAGMYYHTELRREG